MVCVTDVVIVSVWIVAVTTVGVESVCSGEFVMSVIVLDVISLEETSVFVIVAPECVELPRDESVTAIEVNGTVLV